MLIEVEVDENEVTGNLRIEEIFKIAGIDALICKEELDEELLEEFTAKEIVDYYGNELLEKTTIEEIVDYYGNDLLEKITIEEIVDFFGEEEIQKFLTEKNQS